MKTIVNLIFRYNRCFLSSLTILLGIIFSIPGYAIDKSQLQKKIENVAISIQFGDENKNPDRTVIVQPRPTPAPVYRERPDYRDNYYRDGYRWAPYNRAAPRGARVLYYTRDGRPVYACRVVIEGQSYNGKSVAGGPCRVVIHGRDSYQSGFSIRID